MNIDQKLQCLKLAVDLVMREQSDNPKLKDQLAAIEASYTSFCGLIANIDIEDPNVVIDIIDDTSKLLS